jgi:hypothetical protein
MRRGIRTRYEVSPLRRRERDDGAVPSRLRRFDPDGWPGADVWERHRAWVVARDAWEAEHGRWVESLTELLESFKLVPDEPLDPDAI